MGFSLSDLDPKNVYESATGGGGLSPKRILKQFEPTHVYKQYAREKQRGFRRIGIGDSNFFAKMNPDLQNLRRLRVADYGPVNLPAGGVTPLDPVGSDVVLTGAEDAEQKIETYLTADEIEAQKLAEAQAAAEAEAARVAGQEMLARRRRARDAGLLASGFGSYSTGYKTVLGV